MGWRTSCFSHLLFTALMQPAAWHLGGSKAFAKVAALAVISCTPTAYTLASCSPLKHIPNACLLAYISAVSLSHPPPIISKIPCPFSKPDANNIISNWTILLLARRSWIHRTFGTVARARAGCVWEREVRVARGTPVDADAAACGRLLRQSLGLPYDATPHQTSPPACVQMCAARALVHVAHSGTATRQH